MNEVLGIATMRLRRALEATLRDDPEVQELLDEVVARRLDPASAASTVLARGAVDPRAAGRRRASDDAREPFVQFALQTPVARPRVAPCGGRSVRSPAPYAAFAACCAPCRRGAANGQLAAVVDGRLVTLNPDGSGLRTLPVRRRAGRSPSSPGRPDGNRLAFVTAGEIGVSTSRPGASLSR